VRRPVVWIPLLALLIFVAIFRDPLWNVAVALWNVLDAFNSVLTRAKT
jgi:hypothetical protein